MAEKNHMMDIIERLLAQIQEIEKDLENPDILKNTQELTRLSIEHKSLTPVVQKAKLYQSVMEQIQEAREILDSASEADMKELAREDLEENESRLEVLEQELKLMLIPKDPNDSKNAIMEIRAGTGGEEAALFAGDLYRMYSKYIEKQGWKAETLSSNPTGLGGFKEVTFAVSGEMAYGRMKYESGVHRVQRVPATETSGRVHTSAASVVVLTEAADMDIEIDPNDLRVDVFRSSGPGGQSVNTTDSAVRITHQPTGLVVTCQDEKSQHKNKAKAFKVLRARLYDLKQKAEEEKLAKSRRSMIGSGDRSAKIRTYNYPQGRVTDHRINLTLYRLQEILTGDLDETIEKLQVADRNERLKAEK